MKEGTETVTRPSEQEARRCAEGEYPAQQFAFPEAVEQLIHRGSRLAPLREGGRGYFYDIYSASNTQPPRKELYLTVRSGQGDRVPQASFQGSPNPAEGLG